MGKEVFEEAAQQRKKLARDFTMLLESGAHILAPLSKLTLEQKSCVVFLLRLDAIARLVRRPEYHLDEGPVRSYDVAAERALPGLSKVRPGGDPCLEYSIAYVSALASCQKDQRPTGPGPRDEEECFEAWGPMSQSIACAMGQLDGLKHDIGQFLMHQTPPIPIPWEP